MKFYITKNDVRGILDEFLRGMKPDREYVIERKETKRSINKRKKQKLTKVKL